MDGASLTFVGPLVAALEAVGEALDDAAGADVWSLSDDDLAAAIARCEVVAARQAAVGLRLVREAEARDLGRRLGAASTVGWLRHRLRLRPGEAKTRVDLAHRLRVGESDSGPVDYAANVTSAGGRSMPATAAALAAGQVSVDHASVIATTMAELPGGLSVEQERVAESTLAGWAREHDPVTVGRLGRHLVHALDADTLEQREQRAFARRQLRFSEAGDGSTRISGRLDGESAAMVGRPGSAGRTLPGRRRYPGPAHRRAAQRRRPGRTGPPRLHHRQAACRARRPPPPECDHHPGIAAHPAKPPPAVPTPPAGSPPAVDSAAVGSAVAAGSAAAPPGAVPRRGRWAGAGRSRPRRCGGSAATPASPG
jgi:hypothetical protein